MRAMVSDRVLHHLFLLPVYIGILIGSVGALTALALLAWACVLFWQRAVMIVSGLIVLVWAFTAWDYFNSHGWQYKPNESASTDDDACQKTDQS